MAKRKLTDEQEREIVSLYNAGVSNSKIAARYNVSTGTVWAACRRQGNKDTKEKRKEEYTAKRDIKICEMYRAGKSYAKIMGIVHTNYRTVVAVLEDNGVERRKNTVRKGVSVKTEHKPPKMQLCWSCRKATNSGCSWSRSLEPVEGCEKDSYNFIVKCPEFVEG